MATHISRSGGGSREEQSRHLIVTGTRKSKCIVNIRDLDEIDADLGVDKVDKLLTQNIDYDKTGLGQFYCVHCA